MHKWKKKWGRFLGTLVDLKYTNVLHRQKKKQTLDLCYIRQHAFTIWSNFDEVCKLHVDTLFLSSFVFGLLFVGLVRPSCWCWTVCTVQLWCPGWCMSQASCSAVCSVCYCENDTSYAVMLLPLPLMCLVHLSRCQIPSTGFTQLITSSCFIHLARLQHTAPLYLWYDHNCIVCLPKPSPPSCMLFWLNAFLWVTEAAARSF